CHEPCRTARALSHCPARKSQTGTFVARNGDPMGTPFPCSWKLRELTQSQQAVPERSRAKVLFLPEQEVQHEAAPHMDGSLLTAMAEDVLVRTAGFFESVRQDGQVLEPPVLVNGVSQIHDTAVAPGERRGGKGRCPTERVAEDAAEQTALCSSLFFPPGLQEGPRHALSGTQTGFLHRPDRKLFEVLGGVAGGPS